MKTKTIPILLLLSALALSNANAQTLPAFTVETPVVLNSEDVTSTEAGIAINSNEPEVLFTTIVQDASGLGLEFIDPITGLLPQSAVVGYFFNPITMEPSGDPFLILANASGGMEKHDVTYNSFTGQYNVVVAAQGRGTQASTILLVAVVNSLSQAGPENRIANAFAHDEDSAISYQDTGIAAATSNGNFLIVAEYKVPNEDEAVVGMLFDGEGNLLTPAVTRLDQIVPEEDEDDPDVVYLPDADAFLFLTNTDNSQNPNIITGSIVGANPDGDGNLVVGEQRLLAERRRTGLDMGHPSAIENPFNGEFIGVFDYSNGADGGDIFYFNIGPEPNYQLTEARPQVGFLDATGSDPYNIRHPQLAVDENSGVIVIMTNPKGSAAGLRNGVAFTFLGKDGQVLPDVDPENGYSHAFVDTFDPLGFTDNPSISNDANFYDVKYDPSSDSFIGVYADSSFFTFAVKLQVENEAVEPAEGPIVDIRFDGGFASETEWGLYELQGGTPSAPSDLPGLIDDGVLGSGDQSIAFDGTANGLVYVEDTSGLMNFDDASYTLEAWVKIGQPNAAGDGNPKGIIAAYGLPGGYSIWITAEGTIGGTTYGIVDLFTEATVPAEGWHHVAKVHEAGTEVRFYIDGELAHTLPETRGVNPTDDQTLYIGYERAAADPINPFNGWIDRVRVTPLALDPSGFDLEGLPVGGPMLSINAAGGGMVRVEWEGEGSLQSATSVTGPWADVQGASSPYDASANGTAFFRTSASASAGLTFTVDLNGANARPNPITTGATGSGTFTLDGLTLTMDVTYQGLESDFTNAHIHGPAGLEMSAGVLQGVNTPALHTPTDTRSGRFAGTVEVSQATADAIINGMAYLNIHTTGNGGGEIRGQLTAP